MLKLSHEHAIFHFYFLTRLLSIYSGHLLGMVFLKIKFCKLSKMYWWRRLKQYQYKNKRIPTIKLLKYKKPLSIYKLIWMDMEITINGLKNLWMSKFRSTTKQNQIPSYGLEDHISNQHAVLLVLKFSLFYECWIFGIYPDKVWNLVTY